MSGARTCSLPFTQNREMSLEDGRMLISADRYDKLKKTHSKYYLSH